MDDIKGILKIKVLRILKKKIRQLTVLKHGGQQEKLNTSAFMMYIIALLFYVRFVKTNVDKGKLLHELYIL